MRGNIEVKQPAKINHPPRWLAETATHWVFVLLPPLGAILGSYVSNLAVSLRLVLFVCGISVFGFVIFIIAVLLRRKNQDVILLKRRLAEIYLSALTKSALNPLQ
jgi:hypothetical protein